MTTRRRFLQTLGASAAGIALGGVQNMFATPMTSKEWGSARKDKVRIAYIGIGNRGEQNIDEFARTGMVEVTALCDIDMEAAHTQKVMNMYPDAKRYTDFRDMFEKGAPDFDAVCASVPDHMHFPIAMLAMANGKHIYLEKPMCRTFHEAELMMEMARRHTDVVTQVGNQGHSEGNYFQFKAWKDAGIIKDVTAITAHMNNSRRWHGYDDKMIQMPGGEPMPTDIDWDAWTGPCTFHGYSDRYHQGNWRCWYDYGMGALGDWGAHLLDTAHEFLNLGLPYEIDMQYAKGHNNYFFPYSSTILFRFPARDGMPPCDVTWYDGLDNLPPLPANYGASEYNPNIPSTNQGDTPVSQLNPGKIIYGRDLTFKGGSHGSTLSIIPSANAADIAHSLPDVPESPSNHYVNFLRACLGQEKTRSPFEINGVLSQVFCLGVIAQRLNDRLFFDPRTKQFTNNAFANAMLTGMPPRRGWEDFYKLV
ncbi:MAG: Gfo/Idh/MocA family oxidoreductase [Muribaculaceae bacterium]|nr:Gfo/Idh/MocA family oxidoreductase [Muribaculaceae bacterium]